MWGSDYPHDEGTFPYTTEALRTAFAGMPYQEVAAMVGGNAARVYGFDLPALDALAAKADRWWRRSPGRSPSSAGPASPAFARGGSVRVW